MKVEGIPAKLDIRHTHAAEVQICLNDETAKNVRDIIYTTGTVISTVIIVKSLMRITEHGVGRMFYWK